jgi:cyclase
MSAGIHVHSRADLPPARTVEVGDGVFAYIQPDGSWWINNAGFVAGTSTVLSIDSCATEARTLEYLATVRSLVGRDPDVLVNTHHHGDHTNGNCLFPGAAVVGHHRCRELMLEAGILRPDGVWDSIDWGDLRLRPPFFTFDERLDLWVDDLRVELRHLTTAAHTTNDVVAWIPDQGVMFTGDLVFNGSTPFVLMGSVAGAIEALDRLEEFEAEVVVPGHGAPGTAADLDVTGAYLRFVQVTAEQARAAGLTPLEAAREVDLGPFSELLDCERIVGNLHRAYAELGGVRPGEPIDLAAAFADMIAYNGGRPLRCLA